MQVFKVNKNSWHYKMLEIHDSNSWPQDFCTYWRRVVLIGAAIGLLAALGIAIAIGFMYLLGFLVYLTVVAPIEAAKVIGILVAVIAFVSIPSMVSNLIKRFKKSRRTETKPSQPSLFMAKYHSWKHKYCPSIEYTE